MVGDRPVLEDRGHDCVIGQAGMSDERSIEPGLARVLQVYFVVQSLWILWWARDADGVRLVVGLLLLVTGIGATVLLELRLRRRREDR